jgi:deoxyribodipyrimidine photolyase
MHHVPTLPGLPKQPAFDRRPWRNDTQAKKFDPADDCSRRWVPEAGIAAAVPPILDLKVSRWRALDAYQALRAR